ncbi:MAG: PocR ligand-binding domain-containing protein [Spirochaetales bacterium]|nr:PocR ligand-binding domain-containing protein [Spirochaetales bacterium]
MKNNKESDVDYSLSDLLDVDLLQRIQDEFAETSEVQSIIYALDGSPITKGSNFSEYCNLIRSTPKGLRNCIKSDEALGQRSFNETYKGTAMPCLSGRLMDGIAPIVLKGKRIANWGMGHVLFEELDEDWVRGYARDIGLEEDRLLAAYHKLNISTEEQFLQKIKYLTTLGQEISELALVNYQLTQEMASRRKSESRYSAIIKNAIVGVCEITNEGKIDYVNSHLGTLTGFTEEELIGIRLKDILISKRNFESYFNGITDYANKPFSSIGYDFTGGLKQKFGGIRPCRICMTPQINLSNQVVKSTAVIIDMTTEKLAIDNLKKKNMELKESKKQSDLFFDNNINGLCIIDKCYKCLKVNFSYMSFIEENGKLNYFKKDEIWEPFGKETIEKIYHKELDEIEIKKEYGMQLYSFRASPLFDSENRLFNILITLTDITDYQMMIENAMFAERMSGVGMVASGIAHDMKSVFSILGNSNMTMKSICADIENSDRKEKILRTLKTQEHGLQNGRKLLTQILSYAGQTKEQIESFNLKESVEKIIRIFNSEIMNKNAAAVVDVRENIMIEGNSAKFSQIFMNLTANALDAIENNGAIRITESCSNGHFLMVFEDSGGGISSEDLGFVFKAFFTTKEKGTGLGLFSVKNIIEEMGGLIEVESDAGVSTKFIIRISDSDKLQVRVKKNE